MEAIDKRIIYYLLKDGRMSQKKIAEELGISPQALNYRLSKLVENGQIKRFALHIAPEFLGRTHGFAAFRTDMDYEENIFSRFKCLEEITIFGFHGNEKMDLNSAMEKAYQKLGKPIMNYTPPPNQEVRNVGETDRNLIEILKNDPRAPISSIAKRLSISNSSAKKRLNHLKDMRIASVIPILDLSKTDAVIYLLFSDKSREVLPAIVQSLIFQISDGKSSISVCYSDSLEQAKKSIKNVRDVDEKSQVMVVYDYDFLN